MKYIDVDKLLAELDTERKDCLIARNEFKADDPELAAFYEGKAKKCAELYYCINSLKQEQDIIVLNKKDWKAQEQFRKGKDFGKPLKEEQPEVDLEEEISTWIPAHIRGGDNEVWKDTKKAVTEWGGIVARHFYELGKNARKE